MPTSIPSNIETFDSLMVDDDDRIRLAAVTPLSDQPGFDGYLVPFYHLSDRGTYFVPNAFKKTAREQVHNAPHLFQHDTWQPVGKHVAALEDDYGFKIGVTVNEDIQVGAELMSNYRFGVPLGLSIGFDRIADRSGTPADDAKLNRKTAPDFLKNVPINELRAITEARWWESSTVTFAAITSAKATEIRSATTGQLASIADILTAFRAGTLTETQLSDLANLVAAYESAADGPKPDALDDARTQLRRGDIASAVASIANMMAT